jgi:hypothetical protein
VGEALAPPMIISDISQAPHELGSQVDLYDAGTLQDIYRAFEIASFRVSGDQNVLSSGGTTYTGLFENERLAALVGPNFEVRYLQGSRVPKVHIVLIKDEEGRRIARVEYRGGSAFVHIWRKDLLSALPMSRLLGDFYGVG